MAILLVGTACSDSGDPIVADEPKPVPEDSRGATTTSPAAAIDVSTIPDKIDERYVNAVLTALNEVDGKATRLIVQNKQLVLEASSFLGAIYDDEELQEQTEGWLRAIQRGLKNIKPEPGNRRQTVTRIASASQSCIFVQVQEDLAATAVNASPPHPSFVQLVPLEEKRRARGINPTAWMIHLEGETADGSQPDDPCAA